MLGPKGELQTLLHVAGALALGCSLALAAPPIGMSSIEGKLILNDRGKAKIHTFAPTPLAATTHIIETAEGLVVIDAQQFVSGAKEVIAYVRSLNKPVRRLIISHGHPDHWLGLGEWGDVPASSIPEIRNFVNGEEGSFIYRVRKEGIPPYRALGAELSNRRGTIANDLREGTEKIIGLDFVFEKVINGEADVQLLIKLPELKTLIVQDLIFNNMHHFIGQNRVAADALPTFDGWIAAMRKIKNENPGSDLVLVGHGLPTGPAAIDETIIYLVKAREVFRKAKDGDELHRLMGAAFPGLDGILYIDISSRYLYPKK
jgi:glyoxylase-like metal-dependent hydrolase (beta-lactamase superfamily II)